MRGEKQFIEQAQANLIESREKFKKAVSQENIVLSYILVSGHLFECAAQEEVARIILGAYGEGGEGALSRVINLLSVKLIEVARSGHNSTCYEIVVMDDYYRQELARMLERAELAALVN